MPRTHELLQEDAAASSAEFVGQYGIHPNAEALLLAHQASLDPALEAALLKPVDAEATAELDLESIEPEQGGKVLDAAVRGGNIVYVAEATDGRYYKGIVPAEDEEAKAGDPAKAAERATTLAETKMAKLSSVANTNIEAKVAEFRAELQAEAAEALASAREEAQGEAQEAIEEAQAASEAQAETPAEEHTTPGRKKAERGKS